MQPKVKPTPSFLLRLASQRFVGTLAGSILTTHPADLPPHAGFILTAHSPLIGRERRNRKAGTRVTTARVPFLSRGAM